MVATKRSCVLFLSSLFHVPKKRRCPKANGTGFTPYENFGHGRANEVRMRWSSSTLTIQFATRPLSRIRFLSRLYFLESCRGISGACKDGRQAQRNLFGNKHTHGTVLCGDEIVIDDTLFAASQYLLWLLSCKHFRSHTQHLNRPGHHHFCFHYPRTSIFLLP